jgi:hypothetical protein
MTSSIFELYFEACDFDCVDCNHMERGKVLLPK